MHTSSTSRLSHHVSSTFLLPFIGLTPITPLTFLWTSEVPYLSMAWVVQFGHLRTRFSQYHHYPKLIFSVISSTLEFPQYTLPQGDHGIELCDLSIPDRLRLALANQLLPNYA